MDSKSDQICRTFTILLFLIYLRSATATNIDCGGKPFHCVNSTHFMICVDLGAGVTKTVDDFVIHCPPTTSCSANNHFECEYQLPTTTETIIRLGDDTNDSKIDIQQSTVTSWNDITNTVIPLQKTSNTRLLNEYNNTIDISTHADYIPEKQRPQQKEISDNSDIINNSNNISSVRSEHLNYLPTTSETYIAESNILGSTDSHRLVVPSEDDTSYLHDSTLWFSTKSDQGLRENSFAPNITNDITSETNISNTIILNGVDGGSSTISMNTYFYDNTATISTDVPTLMTQEVITTDFHVKTNHSDSYGASSQIENKTEVTSNFDTVGQIAKAKVNIISSHNELNTFINDSFKILSSIFEPTMTGNVRGTTESIGSTKVSSNNLNNNEMFALQYETEITPEVKFTSAVRNPTSLGKNILNDINYKSTSENVTASPELILRSKTIQEIVTESILKHSNENDLKKVPPAMTTDSDYYYDNTASIEYSTTTTYSDLLKQIIQHSKVSTLSPVEKSSPEDIHTTNTDIRNLSLVFLLANDNLPTLSSLSISEPAVTSTEQVTYNKEKKESTYDFSNYENKNKMLEFENAREMSPEIENATNPIHAMGYHISATDKSATTEINVTSTFDNDNFTHEITLTTVELNVIDQNIQEIASENSRILLTEDSTLSPIEVNTLQMSQIIINNKVDSLYQQGQNMSKSTHPEDISTTNAYILDSLVKTEFLLPSDHFLTPFTLPTLKPNLTLYSKEVIDSDTTVISYSEYENEMLQYQKSTELPPEVGATSKSFDAIPLGNDFYTDRSATTKKNMISVFDTDNVSHKITTTVELLPKDEKIMQLTSTIVTESPYYDDTSSKLENITTSEVNIRKPIQIDNRDTTLYSHELYKSKVTPPEDISTTNANTHSPLVGTQILLSNDNFTTLSSLPTLEPAFTSTERVIDRKEIIDSDTTVISYSEYENEMLQYEKSPEVGATTKSFDSIPLGHDFYTERSVTTKKNTTSVFDTDNVSHKITTTVELLPKDEKIMQLTSKIVTESPYYDDTSSKLENITTSEVNIRKPIQIDNRDTTLYSHELYKSKVTPPEDISTTNANTHSQLVGTQILVSHDNFTNLSSLPTLEPAFTSIKYVIDRKEVIDSDTTVVSNDVYKNELLQYENPTELSPEVEATSKSYYSIPLGHAFYAERSATTEINMISVFDNDNLTHKITTTVELLPHDEKIMQLRPTIITESPYYDDTSSKLENKTTLDVNITKSIQIDNTDLEVEATSKSFDSISLGHVSDMETSATTGATNMIYIFDNDNVTNEITTTELMGQEENTLQATPSIVTENPYFEGISTKLENNTTSELNLIELINSKRGVLSSPGLYISKTTLPWEIATTNLKPPKTLVNFSSDNFTTLSALPILEPAVAPVKNVKDRKNIKGSITEASNDTNESKTFWLKYENGRKMPLRLRNGSVDPEMMAKASSNIISEFEIKQDELLKQASVPSSDLTTDSTLATGWQDVILTSTEAPTIIENNRVNLRLIIEDSAYDNTGPIDVTKGMSTRTANDSNTTFTTVQQVVPQTVVDKLSIGNAIRNHATNVPHELYIGGTITEPKIDGTYIDRWALNNTMSLLSPDLTTTETSKWRGGVKEDYPPSTELLVTHEKNMPSAPQLFTPNLVSKMGETLSTYNEMTTEETTKKYYDLLSIENQNPFVINTNGANTNITNNSNAKELEPVSSQNTSKLYFSSKINKSIHDENKHQQIQNYITDTVFTIGFEGTAKSLLETILRNETEQNFITTDTPTPNAFIDFIKKQLNVPSQNISIQYYDENNSVRDENMVPDGDKKYASNITVDETNTILESIHNTDNPDKPVITNTVTMVPMLHSDGILLGTIETNKTPENVITKNNNLSYTQLNTSNEERISNKRSVLVNTEATSYGTQLKVKKLIDNNKNKNNNNKENIPLYTDENIFGTQPKPRITSIVNKTILAKTNLEYRKLLNTVSIGIKVNQSFVNMALFTCKSRLRGRYPDKNDCRKFYICIGKVQPIHGECPANTVFSEIKKQCTKNLSHCFRNNQFHCIQEGRFSDVLRSNIYYICVNNTRTYIRFQFQCHSGYHLNKTSVRCVTDMKFQSQVSSKSVDNDSKKGSDLSTVEKKSKEKKQEKDGSLEKYICRDEGKFPDANDCRKYYVCSKNKSVFRRRIKKCDSDEVFHREQKKCVDSESYECK